MRPYRLTPAAVQDLESIYEYSARRNLSAAGRLLEQFVTAFRQLAEQPGRGHLRDDLTHEPVRFWRVGAYLVIYRPDTEPLTVLRVIHGSRDVAQLLAEE